jgi:hypothetical protein
VDSGSWTGSYWRVVDMNTGKDVSAGSIPYWAGSHYATIHGLYGQHYLIYIFKSSNGGYGEIDSNCT